MDSDTVARIGVYARVFTDRQETENQAMQLREFARRHGLTERSRGIRRREEGTQ